jgi:hypothetical protein
LKTPTALEPPTLGKFKSWKGRFARRNVFEIGIAHLRMPIPFIHRIDCFRELRAVRFVDAANVDPHPSETISESLFTA